MRNIAKSTGMQWFSCPRYVYRYVRKGHPELSQLHNYSVQRVAQMPGVIDIPAFSTQSPRNLQARAPGNGGPSIYVGTHQHTRKVRP